MSENHMLKIRTRIPFPFRTEVFVFEKLQEISNFHGEIHMASAQLKTKRKQIIQID